MPLDENGLFADPIWGSLPADRVALRLDDPATQPLLWEHAERVRDGKVGDDLQARLRALGYDPAKLGKPWECMRLSCRTRNALRKWVNGPQTWAQLAERSPSDLLRQRGPGRKRLDEVRREMARRGLSLKGDHKKPPPDLDDILRRLEAVEHQLAQRALEE